MGVWTSTSDLRSKAALLPTFPLWMSKRSNVFTLVLPCKLVTRLGKSLLLISVYPQILNRYPAQMTVTTRRQRKSPLDKYRVLYLTRTAGRFLATLSQGTWLLTEPLTPELLQRGCHVSVVVKSSQSSVEIGTPLQHQHRVFLYDVQPRTRL
jgi:hypothetical protein